jgi:hypothetical protein
MDAYKVGHNIEDELKKLDHIRSKWQEWGEDSVKTTFFHHMSFGSAVCSLCGSLLFFTGTVFPYVSPDDEIRAAFVDWCNLIGTHLFFGACCFTFLKMINSSVSDKVHYVPRAGDFKHVSTDSWLCFTASFLGVVVYEIVVFEPYCRETIPGLKRVKHPMSFLGGFFFFLCGSLEMTKKLSRGTQSERTFHGEVGVDGEYTWRFLLPFDGMVRPFPWPHIRGTLRCNQRSWQRMFCVELLSAYSHVANRRLWWHISQGHLR